MKFEFIEQCWRGEPSHHPDPGRLKASESPDGRPSDHIERALGRHKFNRVEQFDEASSHIVRWAAHGCWSTIGT